MYHKIGVDVIHLRRIKQAIEENNPSYFQTLYTEKEMEAGRLHAQPLFFYASRFAAKEAVFKAFGISWDEEMEWTQIQILNTSCGSLSVSFFGRIAEVAQSMGVEQADVSVSYDTDYAFATALLSFEEPFQ